MGMGSEVMGMGECETILGHTGRHDNKGPGNAGQPSYYYIS